MPELFISREQAETDLLAAAAYLAERIKSADGHGEAMKSIIPLYLEKGNVDLSAELANQIDEPYARDRMLIAVAEKCADIDDDEYAMQLADAVEDHGLRGQALENIALLKASKGETGRARDIAAGLEHPDFVLAGIAAKEKDVPALAEIEFPSARVSGALQIASGQTQRGQDQKAVAVLDIAVTAANEIEHDEEKIRLLCEIGNAFLDAKRADRAIATFDEARAFAEVLDNTHRDTLLVNCALGLLHAGSQELADRTLDLVTDKTQMASALAGFSRHSWEQGQKDDAVEALDEAYEILSSQRDSETRDSRTRNTLWTSIAAQFAGYGKTERAIEAAHKNPDPAEEMNALAQIAQILVIKGEDELARETLHLIGEDANKLFALIGMSDGKAKAGDTQGAVALLEEAVTFLDSVPQLASRSSALNELAQRFASYELADRAREMLLANLGLLSEIRDESSQAVALAAVSEIYDSIGVGPGDEEFARVNAILRRRP